MALATKQAITALFDVIQYELPQLVDDGDGVLVAFTLGIAPGKQTVAAQNDPIAVGILAHRAPQHHAQFKSRTLPGEPDQMVIELTIELFHSRKAVGRSSQSDAPVRMEMVDMFEWKKPVQGSIDRRGHRALAEGTQRIHVDHFVFVLRSTIAAFGGEQFIQIKCGKSRSLDASEIATTTLDPKNFFPGSIQRIGLKNFGTGVSAAEIGDAQIGSQQVGAVA